MDTTSGLNLGVRLAEAHAKSAVKAAEAGTMATLACLRGGNGFEGVSLGNPVEMRPGEPPLPGEVALRAMRLAFGVKQAEAARPPMTPPAPGPEGPEMGL
jgi:hypothetical protein